MRNVEHRRIGADTSRTSLGSVLFRQRARRHWTLREMSEQTGIPVSTLSKVERDHATLTYDKLQQLSTALGLRLSELFGEGGTAPVVKRDYLYLR